MYSQESTVNFNNNAMENCKESLYGGLSIFLLKKTLINRSIVFMIINNKFHK